MRTVSEMTRLSAPGGVLVESDSATIEATGTPHPDGTLEVVDRSFDVARTETFPLSPGTLFPNAALRRQIAGASEGEVAFGFPTLRADRRQAVRAQVEVVEPIVEAAVTTVSGSGADLLRRPGWRFLIVRRNLSGDEVGRETAIVLDNGVVVDSVYTSGRLRSATTLRTIEPLSTVICEDVRRAGRPRSGSRRGIGGHPVRREPSPCPGRQHEPQAALCPFFHLASLRMMMLRFSVDTWSVNRMPSRWSISCWTHRANSPSAVSSWGRSGRIKVAHRYGRRSGDVGVLVRQRQASLLGGLRLRRCPDQHRVDHP